MPARLRHELRLELEVSGHLLTIVERHPPWPPNYGPQWSRSPVARLRYTANDGLWILFWRDCEEHFHRHEPCPPSRSVQLPLEAIERDQNRVFGG